MKPARSQSNQGITRHDIAAIDDLRTIDHSDGESCQVILAFRVEGRHLGGFSSDQGAAGLTTAFGDPLDYRLSFGNSKLSRCEIIQEEQRFGSADYNVVHTHGHQIDPDGIVAIREEG